MSLASKVAAAVSGIKPKSATAAEISVRVRAAEQTIASLEARHAEVSLAWASDSTSAKPLDALESDLTAARRDLRALRAALTLANDNEKAEERARMASLNSSRVHSATMHLRAAEKHAVDLADGLAKAAKARRGLLESSAKARVSAPTPLPAGSMTEPGALDKAISAEAYRVSHAPKLGHLPGSKAPSINTIDDPKGITPLVDQVRQGHDFAIAVLRGEATEPRTPTLRIVEPDVSAPEPEIAELPDVDTSALQPFTGSIYDLPPVGKLRLTDDE